ncbi:hypothetical protein C9374_008045 [Naegleria lovaniensis]|uniref:Uncharacterized protein n=1 Tax=Naegleria lovaniensis TaxID=51637 RepID=A0AA88KG52_NAELO|nr:uncharacterized protein C9374_008045 [Naegleria lovaniensis]KAG2378897.1 hypothetical protein C9374_008045 [Naegleria lovaniensis]
MSIIKYGCSHGSFLDAPFGKDGCEACAQQARLRFEAAKARRYRFKSSSSRGSVGSNSSEDVNKYYYNVIANDDELTQDGKSRITVGMKIDVDFWDEANNHYTDKNCKLYDEGNISHILANCFAEYMNEQDEIDFSVDDKNDDHLQNSKIHEVLLKRISCYANEIWSLVFHFNHSVDELVNFIRKDVLKKKAENNIMNDTSSSFILPSLEQNDENSNNYGMLGFGVASNNELPGDFGNLTQEDMLLCYMIG